MQRSRWLEPLERAALAGQPHTLAADSSKARIRHNVSKSLEHSVHLDLRQSFLSQWSGRCKPEVASSGFCRQSASVGPKKTFSLLWFDGMTRRISSRKRLLYEVRDLDDSELWRIDFRLGQHWFSSANKSSQVKFSCYTLSPTNVARNRKERTL